MCKVYLEVFTCIIDLYGLQLFQNYTQTIKQLKLLASCGQKLYTHLLDLRLSYYSSFFPIALFFHPFSCKWVGLFVILWAGITTVLNLWDLLGDLTLSLVSSATFEYMSPSFQLILLILFQSNCNHLTPNSMHVEDGSLPFQSFHLFNSAVKK